MAFPEELRERELVSPCEKLAPPLGRKNGWAQGGRSWGQGGEGEERHRTHTGTRETEPFRNSR